MAVDKLVDSTQLNSDLTSVANAIRTKGGTSAQLAFPAGFVSAIGDISGDGGGNANISQDANGYIVLDDTAPGGGGGGSGNLLLIASTAFHVDTEVAAGSDTVNFECDDNLYNALLSDFNSLTNEYQNMYLPVIAYNGADLGGFVAGFEPVRLSISGSNISVQYQSTYHRYFKAASPGFGETSDSGMALGYAVSNQTSFVINPSETYVSIKTMGAVALKAGDYSVSVFRINAPNLGSV